MSKAVIASFRPSFAPGGGTKSPTEENPMPVSTLYNPQEMPEDAFRQSFVVRRGLLEDLLREIRKAAPGQRFQHTILQGQRGQGKTTLLRKLSLCVRDDPELSGWLIPILFREEEYSVVALCRLWERTADYLAEHPGFENLPEQFEAALVSPHYEKDCFDILAHALEREDKHLLLLIDNFGEMLDKFGKADQQRFREILLTSRRIRIVAGSAATLEQHYDHGKPFFNFFRLRTLEGLNAQEARELMLSLGDEDQKKRMAEILEIRPGKLEALRRLTAGVPRTLVLLFEIFLDDDGSAMEDLEVLLDRVTPLYKHRLDDLPTQQQAIVYEIAMGWDAMSVKEIAAKARLPSKQISAQLQLLEKNRIVRSIATSTKNKLYQLEERFFNIWCLMRLGRSGDKRRAVWLVRFLEIWCDQKELAERVRRHIEILQDGKIAPEHALFLTQAYAEVLQDMELQEELLEAASITLSDELIRSLPEADRKLLNRAQDLLSAGEIQKATKLIEPLAGKGHAIPLIILGIIYTIQKKSKEASLCYRSAFERDFNGALLWLRNWFERNGRLDLFDVILYRCIENGVPMANLLLGLRYLEQEKLDLSEKYLLLAADQDVFGAFTLLGILYDKKNDYGRAERFLRAGIENEDVNAMFMLAFIYFIKLHDHCEKALQLAATAAERQASFQEKLLLSCILLWRNDYVAAFQGIDLTIRRATEAEQDQYQDMLGITIRMLGAKNQTAFALKLFEDDKYAALNLKERLKPLYYAILQEAGPSRADDALRMGSELEETVAEIRREIERMRQDYRIDAVDAAAEPAPVDNHP
jgi:hypothetical protein